MNLSVNRRSQDVTGTCRTRLPAFMNRLRGGLVGSPASRGPDETKDFEAMTDSSRYAATFELIDADHDGRIDHDEFQSLMNALGPGVDPQVASSMFAGMDGDTDGLISLDELSAYLDANPA